MDLDKFKLFRSGMTEEQREELRKHEEVEAVFKKEASNVNATMRTKGFRVILDKVVDDIEVAKAKLLTCNEKELARLQLEIKVRREFLDKWTPYAV